MRFDLRPRSIGARPKSVDLSDASKPPRGHSARGHATIPIPHTMTRNMSRPVPPPSVAPAKSRAELPPVDELFPRLELEPRMKKHLVRVANETSNALIKDTLMQDESGSVVWRPVQRPRGTAGNVHVLRATAGDANKPNDATCVRAVSDDVHASIEEFALLFKLDSSREAADHLLLFNADLVRHSTLYTLVAPSGLQPRRYVGIKWALVASPSKIFRNRDFCYLECQKEFTDARGRRGWVRSLHSLKLPCCPSLEKEHGIVRASIYRSGLTAVETDEPGVLSVTYTVELDLKGRMALELLQPGFLAQRVAALATVDKLLQQQRLSSSPLLGDLDIPAKKRTRSSCHLCFREFLVSRGLRDTIAAITHTQTKSKRYVCRKCGEGVCRRCSDDWWLDVPVVGRTKVCICTVCSAEAKQSHTSAHMPRAGTCPIQRANTGPITEVVGVTHPNLLPPRPRQRSVSMVEQPCDSLQQEDRKRDTELHVTELSVRATTHWDEMQVDDCDAGLPQQERTPLSQQRELMSDKHEWRTEAFPSRMPVSKVVKPEAQVELKVARDERARRVSRCESDKRTLHDRYPSFLSSEVSSNQEHSDTEEENVIRLTAEAGARLSSDYRDSDLSDYEEHTIDGLGEIRTTTDITRWWRDQQLTDDTLEQAQEADCRQPSVQRPESHKQQRAPTTSALQQIQQRQTELEQLRRNQQQRPSDQGVVSAGMKEQYLEQQRQQQAHVAAAKQARRKPTKSLDETTREGLELMETSQGEWVPTNEKARGSTNEGKSRSSPRRGAGCCRVCGSPEVMGGNGRTKASCQCCANGSRAVKAGGTVLFDGQWITNPVLQEAS
ncbi:hypothetical protein PsorP6_011946 [Peronosclerospora sorghi]|uniref:Uncharacterized protein n=1 Tax=Peronosclerospora sorghi TaxID=230839 RepID=A0ACC0WIT6_9STRA|nr:hypothetical protein PsorP6_011946 [Peronosclerospora sorghi]